MEKFGFFCHFRFQSKILTQKTAKNSSEMTTGQHIFFLYLPFSTFQPTKSDVNLAKMHEIFITRKLSRFLIIFDVNLRHFQLEKCNKPFR